MHTFGLNAALGIALPHTPSALAPVVVAVAVITAIRSPWGHLTGPALNMGPATVGAFMHGGESKTLNPSPEVANGRPALPKACKP